MDIEWITDRNPDKDGSYIVALRTGTVEEMGYTLAFGWNTHRSLENPNAISHEYGMNERVAAWAQFPKPYPDGHLYEISVEMYGPDNAEVGEPA